MKKIFFIFTATFLFDFCSIASAQMAVTDVGTYSYLNGLDKKAQEQLGFMQKIQDAGLATQAALEGNKRIGYGVNASMISYDDFFQFRNRASQDSRLNGADTDKPAIYIKNIESLFPSLKVKVPANQDRRGAESDLNKKNYRQNSLKAALIFSEMILGSSRARIVQITSLATEVDNAAKLKEALDLNNRLLLESILESRNTNILLANLTKIVAARDYEGLMVADYTEAAEESKDLLEGRSAINSSINRISGNGKFKSMTR